MIFKAKVRKLGDQRRILELPKSIRDNFEVGKEYNIELTSQDN